MRSIVHEQKYAQQLAEIIPDVRRADEFIRGAEWTLSRNPEEGTQVAPDSEVWFLPVEDNIPDTPAIALYYTFSDQYVWFLSIELS